MLRFFMILSLECFSYCGNRWKGETKYTVYGHLCGSDNHNTFCNMLSIMKQFTYAYFCSIKN